MDPSGTAFDPALLLGQRDWIRRLARELAADPSAADDLAQEAWLVAAEQTPAGPLLPWIRGVLKRLALQRRREHARRVRRERERARPEALPATDELVQRAELQGRVAEAVVALPEPYRSTLLLRYFEELDAAEIARRRGVPAATVRSQLARGLARLRVELDERQPGGRAAWMGVVVGWLGDASESAAAASAGGLSFLGGLLAMKAMLVAGAIASGVLVWWLATSAPGPEEAQLELTSTRSEQAPREAQADLPASTRSSSPQRASALPAASAQGDAGGEAPERTGSAAAQEPARIEARIVDERGRSIPGATLELEDPRLSARSDAGGRVSLELEVVGSGRSVSAIARAPGHASRRVQTQVSPGARVPLGELVLGEAGSISGRILHARGGGFEGVDALASGTAPSLEDPEQLRRHGPRDPLLRSRGDDVVEGRVEADGSFRIENVPAGPALVWAGGGDFAWSSSGPLVVRAGEELKGIELGLEELESSDRIGLLVLDPGGEPVPSARVVVRYVTAQSSTTRSLSADASGRFRLLVDQRVPHDFEVVDPQDRWSPIFVAGVEPGAREQVLRFEEPRWIEIHAHGPGGEPVGPFQVEAQRQTQAAYWERTGSVARAEAEPWSARLRVPSIGFRVLVDAPGHALATLGPFDPLDAPEKLVAALEELPGVRGRVLAGRVPAAGVRVSLHRLWPETAVFVVNGFRCLIDRHSAVEATTDPAGRFHLELREEGRYFLRAQGDPEELAEIGPLALDPRQGARDLELHLRPGGAIEGRLVPVGGADPTGRVVAVHRGDGDPRMQRVEKDGRYRFEGLMPGMWQVLLREGELDSSSSVSSFTSHREPVAMEWSCEVFAGETTWFELSEEREECVLEGKLALGGALLEGWSAKLSRASVPNESPTGPLHAALAEDGRFRIVAARGGVHRLELRAPGSERGGLVFELDLELHVGPNELALTLPAAALTGEGAPVGSRSETLLEFRWRSPEVQGLTARARVVPGADGSFSLPLLPAGAATIQAYEPSATPGAAGQWTQLALFELPAGGALHLRLHGR